MLLHFYPLHSALALTQNPLAQFIALALLFMDRHLPMKQLTEASFVKLVIIFIPFGGRSRPSDK
jgi:hypothetical protein